MYNLHIDGTKLDIRYNDESDNTFMIRKESSFIFFSVYK